jgi:hypothetical protein
MAKTKIKVGDLVECPSKDTFGRTVSHLGIVLFLGSDRRGHYIQVSCPFTHNGYMWHRQEDVKLISRG